MVSWRTVCDALQLPIAVLTSSPLSLSHGKMHFSFCFLWVLQMSAHKILSQHATFYCVVPPSPQCDICFQGKTVLCKSNYLYIPRPLQENWNQPHHGHAAFTRGYWRKSRQRGSCVQSHLMRSGVAGWVSPFQVFTSSIHRKIPT